MDPLGKGLIVASLAALTLAGPRALEDEPRLEVTRPEVGVQFHAGWTTYTDEERLEVVDKLADAGVGWLRIDVGWCSIEPEASGEVASWYVDNLDAVVDAARERGMEILMTLWCTPRWASSAAGDDYVTRAAAPKRSADYRRIAEWAARHWRGRVAAWEIWNEPDLPAFFGGDPVAYVELLKAGYRGIRAGDADAQVVLGGPVPNDVEWIQALYRNGAKPFFDVLATHPYSVPLDHPPELINDPRAGIPSVANVRAVMKRFGDADKPIWFTEFGWSTHPNDGDESKFQRGVSRAEQADFIVRALRYTRCQRPYVEKAFIYAERDRKLDGSKDPHTEHVSRFGLLDENLEPKPSYDALAWFLTSSPADLCADG
jgi:hypothetical protein